MPKFSLRFERYLQAQSVVEIEADSLDDAVGKARDIDISGLDREDPDADCATAARLYSVEADDEILAQVTFAQDYGQSWTNVCLIAQWGRVLGAPQSSEEIRAFAAAASAHYGQLRPEISDELLSEVEASRLRDTTPQAASDALPIRKRL
ncbi:hypothetical protein LU699_15460 [Luteimonas fraxinea]|uniref:hypothetical protein n=1 Tax=Luteimonas fraxinea TaxID=2901869 RepID=UPI001E4DE646|nr:hypothetical protein [Luteimonas fraxinea]UHH09640.1 hypothetical protein LU699_15460 [Luteimonas fraxinea]